MLLLHQKQIRPPAQEATSKNQLLVSTQLKKICQIGGGNQRCESNLHWISPNRLAPRYVGGHEIQEAGSLPRLSICNPIHTLRRTFAGKRWVGALGLIGWLGLFVVWLCFVDVSVCRWARCLVWKKVKKQKCDQDQIYSLLVTTRRGPCSRKDDQQPLQPSPHFCHKNPNPPLSHSCGVLPRQTSSSQAQLNGLTLLSYH